MSNIDDRLTMPARTYLTWNEYRRVLSGADREDRTVSNFLRRLVVAQLDAIEGRQQ